MVQPTTHASAARHYPLTVPNGRHAGFSKAALTPHGRGFQTSLGYFHADEDHWTQVFTNPSIPSACPPALNHSGGIVDLWDTDRPAHGMNGTSCECFRCLWNCLVPLL